MSRLLSELLGADERLLASAIDRLERASGQKSIDIRLAAEIVAKTHAKVRALGLDPKDTNGRELYHGLQDMVSLHDQFMAKVIGAQNPADVADVLPRIVHAASRLRMPRQVWALRHSVGKRLLKANPPKRLMRALGYRSLDSLLKREPMGVVFSAMRFLETPQWQANFVNQYRSLTPSDFEIRPIEIVYLDTAKWEQASRSFVQSSHHNITHSKEMGSIIVLPLPISTLPGLTITVLPLLLHYINELRVYSALFKLQQVKPDFGRVISATILHDPTGHAGMAGQQLHWRVVHKHFGKRPATQHPEIFEPHVQVEDLEWRAAEDVLFHLEPALQFWQDMQYVGKVIDGRVVSFNLMDAATNFINQMSFDEQVNYHLRDSLQNEIYARYMGEAGLESQVLATMEQDLMVSDMAPLRSLLR